jgi:hypothetical protein
VTPQQAEALTAADANAQLRLALRSPLEAANSLPAHELTWTVQGPPTPQPNTKPAHVGSPVDVIIDDSLSTVWPDDNHNANPAATAAPAPQNNPANSNQTSNHQ